MGNSNLRKAAKNKNDEFYTQYETIEEALIHYKKHFNGKAVYCNCDDPRWSNFFKYFVDNFHELKLKRLIASCYVDQSYNLFTINEEIEPAVWASYDGWLIDGRAPDVSEIEMMELEGDGDFRSEESVELLKQADIVVTNPPFSLFRQFIPLMMKYEKKFLVIGSSNSVIYKNVFPLVKGCEMWLGYSKQNGINFYLPNGEVAEVNAAWWTNIGKPVKHEDITLAMIYKGNEDKYPKYDNYNAINVDKVAEIPLDYKGVIGVPITFIGQWNPEQFEILGVTPNWDESNIHNGKSKIKDPVLNGKKMFTRLLIQNKRLNPDIYENKADK